jgi:hypothetical protein
MVALPPDSPVQLSFIVRLAFARGNSIVDHFPAIP